MPYDIFSYRQRSKERIVPILSVFRGKNQEQKLEQGTACIGAGFPICLSEGLITVFGADGKKFLDTVVMKGAYEHIQVASQKDICDLYSSYMKRLASIIGESPAMVIQFESFKLMKSAFCEKCPLNEEELERRKLSSSD